MQAKSALEHRGADEAYRHFVQLQPIGTDDAFLQISAAPISSGDL